MKDQAIFSLKDKNNKLICHLLQFLFGALRLKTDLKTMQEIVFKTFIIHYPKCIPCTDKS